VTWWSLIRAGSWGQFVMAFVLCYLQPPVVPRDDVLLQLTMSLVQAVLQLKERFKGATTEQYCEFVKVRKRRQQTINVVVAKSLKDMCQHVHYTLTLMGTSSNVVKLSW